MNIPSRFLHKYIDSLVFPVEIFAERDDRVMYRMDKEQFLQLVAENGVVGTGSKARVRKLRLNRITQRTAKELADREREIKLKKKSLFRSSASQTVIRQHLADKFPCVVIGHHPARCTGFGGERVKDGGHVNSQCV